MTCLFISIFIERGIALLWSNFFIPCHTFLFCYWPGYCHWNFYFHPIILYQFKNQLYKYKDNLYHAQNCTNHNIIIQKLGVRYSKLGQFLTEKENLCTFMLYKKHCYWNGCCTLARMTCEETVSRRSLWKGILTLPVWIFKTL